MKITKRSPFSGKINSMELPITPDQIDRWQNGELIQNVFPTLSADQREFLMTGITAGEWETTFAKDKS
jgi:hypothetical protein